jgi:AmmeMemoRadiSam system protein A
MGLLGALAWEALREHCFAPQAEPPEPVWPPLDPLLVEAAAALGPEGGLLAERIGVFVTIFRDNALRGCLGAVEGREPLWRAVPLLARAAASADARFSPVESAELPDLRLEITCLGPLAPLPAEASLVLENLKPEVHGVWIRLGEQSGLLLPQVARRCGWDALELLDQMARKAGLPPGAWRSPSARIAAFRAHSFLVEAPPEVPRKASAE